MFLNDISIIKRLISKDPNKKIIITPLINLKESLGSSSIDVRLGTRFKVLRRTHLTSEIDPITAPDILKKNVIQYTEDIQLKPLDRYVLHPNELTLATTLEYIRLPPDIAALLEGRSSWGRLGLQISTTAAFVEPGFAGVLTFELSNFGKLPIPLYPSLRIAQLGFYQLIEPSHFVIEKLRTSKYQQSMRPGFSKFYEDPEIERIRKEKTKPRKDLLK